MKVPGHLSAGNLALADSFQSRERKRADGERVRSLTVAALTRDGQILGPIEATFDFVMMPTTHPWGSRSFWFRDPDGNIVDFVSWPAAQ